MLDVTDLHVAYGKAEVVHGASLTVGEGEFVALLGRNGAGKSTTLHAVSGLIPNAAGRSASPGQDITHATPRDIVRAGLVQVLEGHRVFHSLTVEDNLLIGTYARAPRGDRSKLGGSMTCFPNGRRRQQPASACRAASSRFLLLHRA